MSKPIYKLLPAVLISANFGDLSSFNNSEVRMESASIINGWDIGGVNIKAIRAEYHGDRARVISSGSIPFEIWHKPDDLAGELIKAADSIGLIGDNPHAVTITAELSDAFRIKREGIHFILDAFKKAFHNSQVFTFNLNGGFYNLEEAEKDPLLCAASNWLASASYIANLYKNCILIDVGSTTTDIILIKAGQVICKGRTDTGRLMNSELVYSGVLRTNPNTIVKSVPIHGRDCPVAAEYFTIMADVYLILGDITADEYSCPTPDKRETTKNDARERLARLVCADTEMLTEKEIDDMARYLRKKQTEQILEAISNVLAMSELPTGVQAVVTGTGAFLAERAARHAGINNVVHWKSEGDMTCLPAFAATYLLNHFIRNK
jgi:(4-(4-[2-(gamma-L-glutamylamino)ethyl]phenoxymethyl)furan-2-yl)methanamine synthase